MTSPIPPDGQTAKHLARMLLTADTLRQQIDEFSHYLHELHLADSPEFDIRGISPLQLVSMADVVGRMGMVQGSLASLFMWTQTDVQARVDEVRAGKDLDPSFVGRMTISGAVLRAHIVLDTDNVPDDAREA